MRRFLALGLLCVCSLTILSVLSGCGSSRTTSTDASAAIGGDLERVVLMLNWYPEAEHGGFYAAKQAGIFERYGLDVEIRAGGPKAPVAQELVTGRVQFAIGNADDVLLFRQENVPVVALMAPLQNTPRCVLVREDSGVTDLSGLSGMILQANVGRPFLSFMESQGLLKDVQIVPYAGSLTQLLSDKKTAIQAYSFSEPFVATEQGVAVRKLMLSDIGFNPYASCLLATQETVDQQPDLVGRMVVACREGWQTYLESPAQANAAILAANQHGMTAEALEFGVQELQPLCLPENMSPEEIGAMTAERWSQLIDQFAEIDLIDKNRVVADQVFTNKFIERSATLE